MPNNRIKTIKALQSRKSNVTGHKIHPNSRRAKQLQRVELRTRKLITQAKVQRNGENLRVDRHLYFIHALPSDATSLSLPQLHVLLKDYINRNATEITQLQQERSIREGWRKGEGKTKREIELDGEKEKDLSEYRSGFALPDLTLATNVFLSRQWTTPLPSAKDPNGSKGGDPSFLGRIRLVRIFSGPGEEGSMVVVQEGAREGEWEAGEGEVEMDDGGEDDEEEGETME